MSSCLSKRALMRVVAELGAPAEHAHLATCAACAARYRRLTGEMDVIRHVLATSPEPSLSVTPAPRRWVPAMAALSAVVMVSALLWIEVTVWRTIQSASDAESAQQVVGVLGDISSALLSVDGEPASVRAQSLLAALDQRSEANGVCDESAWPEEEAPCARVPSGFEEVEDPIEAGAVEASDFEWENSDQGEEP